MYVIRKHASPLAIYRMPAGLAKIRGAAYKMPKRTMTASR
jgi:hypothetical protein